MNYLSIRPCRLHIFLFLVKFNDPFVKRIRFFRPTVFENLQRIWKSRISSKPKNMERWFWGVLFCWNHSIFDLNLPNKYCIIDGHYNFKELCVWQLRNGIFIFTAKEFVFFGSYNIYILDLKNYPDYLFKICAFS